MKKFEISTVVNHLSKIDKDNAVIAVVYNFKTISNNMGSETVMIVWRIKLVYYIVLWKVVFKQKDENWEYLFFFPRKISLNADILV